MRNKTINKYEGILDAIIESGMSVSKYCKEVANISDKYFYTQMKKIAEGAIEDIDIRNRLLHKYEIAKRNRSDSNTEIVDNNDISEAFYERDSDGKIVSYRYKIYKKNKPVLDGSLSRDEMRTIYRLYTWYGDGLTARVVSRHFPELSLPDFKRILKVFNVYKDNCPFPAHMIEELSEDELREIQLREKENSFLRKAEEDDIKNDKKLLKKYANENIELKKQLNLLTDIKINIDNIEPYYVIHKEDVECNTALNIYLSDVHLGAAVEQGSLYKENINYGFDEAKRRLSEIIERLCDLRTDFNTINLCMLGDNLDCCGFTGYTASMTHQMPENMDPRTQFNKFIELYDWFIRTINENNLYSKELNVYSVPTGNHSGNYEYALNNALKYYTESKFPGVKFTLFQQFFGVFEQNGIKFCLTHGKPGAFMQKGLPLNIDDKTKIKIYEWLDNNGIYGDNIHIIKGDLHSNNLNSCKKFTYRNVLSLFGESDFSAYGFSKNSYGLSYDIILGNQVVSGTIENI